MNLGHMVRSLVSTWKYHRTVSKDEVIQLKKGDPMDQGHCEKEPWQNVAGPNFSMYRQRCSVVFSVVLVQCLD